MPAASSKQSASKKQARVFTSVEDISAGLHAQNHALLVENLTALRNQLSIRPGEDTIPPQDERLLLARHWLENVPGGHDIFSVWDSLSQRQNSVFSLIVAILSSLLGLTSSHYTFQSLGHPIMKTLLTPTYTRRLNSYLGGTHAELILVTLKLYNAMSNFGGGRERKGVLDVFGWEIKSLPKLLNMRRKGGASDALVRPDIRTLYILFLLSFIRTDTPIQVKTTFFEQHREPFLAMFKGVVQDSFPVVRMILEACWAGLWSDPKVKRTLKISLFSETTISHLMKLYERNVEEGDEPNQVPADLLHHFLLAICTRPGTGICFRDRGWYPRESDDGDDETARGKIHNKILANVLKSLKVNEDLRQQELALKVMGACPELVSGYWTAAALTLEPRLSSKWIANIAFFGSVLSLPVPTSSFYLPNSMLYSPTPPPLSSIIENILPSVNTKAHFSKGLQSPSGLVQHCAAIALAKCLAKYEQTISVFRTIEHTLEENEADGQWCKRRRDIEREARRRVPEFQVIVAFSQQKFDAVPTAPGAPTTPPNPTRGALLAESAQRLLWMYQRCLPLVVAEARFDVGKLLQAFSTEVETAKSPESSDSAKRLHVVKQLHVLRLLKDSDQFGWSGKMGSTSQSYLAVLLKAYTVSEVPATRASISHLLQHILSESIMFQDDPIEPHLWLVSLPTSQRARGTESPDGATLTDEGDSVIAFLDDCVQRCLKTPYRYIEDLHALANTQGIPDKFDVAPSPLLMTVLEQLEIKVAKKSVSASDVLALASFTRKLVFRLSSKQQDLRFLRAVTDRFDTMLQLDRLFVEHPVMSAAIRREVSLLRACLSPQPLDTPMEEVSQEVEDFLSAVEQMPIPSVQATCKSTSLEFVDWLRLVEDTLGAEEIRRVSTILRKMYLPSLSLVAEYVAPIDGSLWRSLDLVSRFSEIQQHLQFDFLFLHASEAQFVDGACRGILAEAAIGHEPNVVEARKAIFLICHRLSSGSDNQTKGLLLLLAAILERASTILSQPDLTALKETLFARSLALKSSLTSDSLSDVVREGIASPLSTRFATHNLPGLHHLVENTLDATNPSDRALIADTTAFWLEALKASLSGTAIQKSRVSIWIKYFEQDDLFQMLDALLEDTAALGPPTLEILVDILVALRALLASQADAESELIQRLPQLMALRSLLAESDVLDELVAVAIESSIPAYCDGAACGEALEETSLAEILKRSDLRWSRQSDLRLVDLPARSFLIQQSWSPSTVTIISGLIYRNAFSQDDFASWLATDHCTHTSPEHFVTVVHAFLDTAFCRGVALPSDAWLPQFNRLTKSLLDEGLSEHTRTTGVTCALLMARLFPSRSSEFLADVVRAIQSLPVMKVNLYLLSLGRQLHAIHPAVAKPLVTELVDHGVQWAVRFFAEPEDASFNAAIEELTLLVKLASEIKPHLVETLMGVVIQTRLAHLPAVKLITALLSNVHLKVSRYPATYETAADELIKPVVVNRSWFVLERWITDNPYKHANAPGQSDLDVARGPNARETLEAHWDNWIVEEDFKWTAQRGFNTVRIPIGYYHICGADPSVLHGTAFHDFQHVFAGAWPRITRAIELASEYGLGVLIDLHAAPGKQNNDSHSGTSDPPKFFNDKRSRTHTIDVLCSLLRALNAHAQSRSLANLVGIELINEPHPPNDNDLQAWYASAIAALRAIDSSIPLYLGECWRPDSYATFVERHASNALLVLDHHLYRCFTAADNTTPAHAHTGALADPGAPTPQTLSRVSEKLGRAGGGLVVGEWSGALNPGSLTGAPGEQAAYVRAQLDLYERTCAGWFFWTFKKQWPGDSGWSLRDSVGAGVFPDRVGAVHWGPRRDRNGDQGRRARVREEMRDRALDAHTRYWSKHRGNYQHWRFGEGFVKGWEAGYLFIDSGPREDPYGRVTELGFKGAWARQTTQDHGEGYWEYEHGFLQGVEAAGRDLLYSS
ncbi:hypothetical protein DXG03_006683 [Asterophora parasitica]|uniref:Uncharacterized protein n=1 Tax=Asterophora parasitica TaxID=117018 RepID=A0A9P7K8B0_9AGAR|nr:hypothetical protein DXG03_006683 [Asterophora parasitica]